MLRSKLFLAFAALAVVLLGLAALIGVGAIRRQALDQAQKRVALDLVSAWSVIDGRFRKIEAVLDLLSGDRDLAEAARTGEWTAEGPLRRIADGRRTAGLDFLGIADANGVVRARAGGSEAAGAAPPGRLVAESARRGASLRGFVVLSAEELAREDPELSARARLDLEYTPRARPADRDREERGLVLFAAAPLRGEGDSPGTLYGGILLNRNHELADRIENLVYQGETHGELALGTATIFLHDRRIATTVRGPDGVRALGTRVSREVAERVLDAGESWIGRAFVVRDWYLTAYDPIRDTGGEVVGMLYVGILEKPFRDLARSMTLRFLGLMLFGAVLAMAPAYALAGRLSRPIHRLAEAARTLAGGGEHAEIVCRKACREIEWLVGDFNHMARTLGEREAGLLEAKHELEAANTSLQTLNASYMDMLGFVSHELKSPVAAIQNYVWLLAREKLGPVNDRQKKALRVLDQSQKRMAEMVRHYLNLSRIENGEMQPTPARSRLRAEIVDPVVESLRSELEERSMRADIEIPEDLEIEADPAQLREVVDNLVGNAVKYGRDGGRILVRAAREDDAIAGVVHNEGKGIPADRLEEVFGKFSRLEPGARQRGTGLGLFISRHILRAHGGDLHAASEPGSWAEFRFRVPQPPLLRESGKGAR